MSELRRFTISNNIMIAMWLFTVILTAIGGVFYYLLLTQPLEQTLFNTLMSGFFLLMIPVAVVGLWVYSLKNYISAVSFDNKTTRVIVKKQYLYKKELQVYTYKDIEGLIIEETKDSEGDPYFKLNIIFRDKEFIILKEAHTKEYLEEQKHKIETHLKDV
jgi:hypothetical protein